MSDVWAPGIVDEDRAWRRGDYDLPDMVRGEDVDDERDQSPDWMPW